MYWRFRRYLHGLLKMNYLRSVSISSQLHIGPLVSIQEAHRLLSHILNLADMIVRRDVGWLSTYLVEKTIACVWAETDITLARSV